MRLLPRQRVGRARRRRRRACGARSSPATSATWSLSRSADGGRTFAAAAARARRRLEDHRLPASRRPGRDRRARPALRRLVHGGARRIAPTCCSPSPPTAGASARRGACTPRPARCPTTRGWRSDAAGRGVVVWEDSTAVRRRILLRSVGEGGRSLGPVQDAVAGDQGVGAGRRRGAGRVRGGVARGAVPRHQDDRALRERQGGRGSMTNVSWAAVGVLARRARAAARSRRPSTSTAHRPPSRRRSRAGPKRVTMEELHRGGGVPPGWRFSWPAGDAAQGPRGVRQARVLPVSRGEGRDVPRRDAGSHAPRPRAGRHGRHTIPAEYFAESIINPERGDRDRSRPHRPRRPVDHAGLPRQPHAGGDDRPGRLHPQPDRRR